MNPNPSTVPGGRGGVGTPCAPPRNSGGPIRYLRQWLAIRRLNRLVAKQRNSFDCEDFRRRRAAALKHTPKVWG